MERSARNQLASRKQQIRPDPKPPLTSPQPPLGSTWLASRLDPVGRSGPVASWHFLAYD